MVEKIKGIKRHIITYANGLILAVNIHSASIQDRDGAINTLLLLQRTNIYRLSNFADGGCCGELQNWCFLNANALLEIIKRKTEKFEILPIRW